MKIIPKYNSGGSFYSVYTATPETRQVQEKQQVTEQKEPKESEDKGKLTEKDLFSMIKDLDGIKIDMNKFATKMSNMLSIYNLVGLDNDDIKNMFMRSLVQIRVMNNDKKLFDKAIEESRKSGGLDDVAINNEGKLIVQDGTGELHTISLDEYMGNQNNYHLLTNSNLAWLRNNYTQDNSIIDVIDSSIGVNSFMELLDKAKSKLGSQKYSETGLMDEQALLGLQYIKDLPDDKKREVLKQALDGVYSYEQSQDSNINQVNSLINYLTNMLSQKYKTWAAIKLNNPNPEEAARQLVTQYLGSSYKNDSSYKVFYRGTEEKLTKGGNGSSEDKTKIMNAPTKFLAGLGDSQTLHINVGNNDSIIVKTNTMPYTKANGDYVGSNSTLQTVSEGQYNPILDLQNVTIGGVHIDSSKFSKIVLLDGKATSIDFPYKEENGNIVPNFNLKLVASYNKANEELAKLGITPDKIKANKDKVNAIYKRYGLDPGYDSEGVATKWRRFAVSNAYVDSTTIEADELDDNPLLKEIKDDKTVDNLIAITKNEDFSKGWFSSDKYYQGTVWIPIKVNYQSALANKDLSVSQAMDEIEPRQQALDRGVMLNDYPIP